MKNSYIVNLIIGLVFSMFFLTLSIMLVLNYRSIYNTDIDMLDIESKTGCDKEVLLTNYNNLIDYYTGGTDDLKFDNFSPSSQGIEHFKNVKSFFNMCKVLCVITFILCIILVVLKIRQPDYRFLYSTALATTSIPGILLLAVLLNFQSFFDWFRRFFISKNNYKLNPDIDVVTKILPNKFYMHCFILILLFCILCGVGILIIYKEYDKRDLFPISDETSDAEEEPAPEEATT